MRAHIKSELDAAAVGGFTDFRFAFCEACDEIFVQPASVFDDVAFLVVEFFGVGLDESYGLLKVGPLGVLAKGNLFLDHVQRDRHLDDAEVVAIEFFTGEVEEVVGYKLASEGGILVKDRGIIAVGFFLEYTDINGGCEILG